MRLLKSTINTNLQTGLARLLPEDPTDLWHLYNLIAPGDIVRASAIRKVTTTNAATSSTSTTTVRTTFSIRVKSLDYDATANSGAGELHVLGRICEENPHAKMGAHHTLDLEVGRQLSLEKTEGSGGTDEDDEGKGGWDTVARDILREATDNRTRATCWVVTMQEGLANICVVTEYQTILRQRVDLNVAVKKGAAAAAGAHEKDMGKFFEVLTATLLRGLDLNNLAAAANNAKDPQTNGGPGTSKVSKETGFDKFPPLVLASPGFTASTFQQHLKSYAIRIGDKLLQGFCNSRVIIGKTSTASMSNIPSLLSSPAVTDRLKATRFARDTQLMNDFKILLMSGDSEKECKAWYGHNEVQKAVEAGAVGRGGGKLLLSDALFRSSIVGERKRWVELVDRVKGTEGGEVRIFSGGLSMNGGQHGQVNGSTSGRGSGFATTGGNETAMWLDGLGGVACICTFPVYGLDENSEDERKEP